VSATAHSGTAPLAMPDAAEVRDQLRRIMESPDFDATDRTRRFLAYIVEETLAGRSERIKAYAIATQVFGRDATFDAHSDPIVRIEAGHLRRTLDRFYLTAGASDAVVISVPKGSYVSKFETRRVREQAAPRSQPIRWKRALAFAVMAAVTLLAWAGFERMGGENRQSPALPRLLVRSFDNLTSRDNSQAIALGLTREIVGQIAKFKDIVTVEENATPAPTASPRYALTGDVEMTEDGFRLRARVINSDDNSVIWANSYDGDLRASKLIGVEVEIARQVASALGHSVDLFAVLELAVDSAVGASQSF